MHNHNIVIIYSTIDGHTRKIGEFIAALLNKQGATTVLTAIEELDQAQLAQADQVILGASIRYGKHRANVVAFVKENQALLKQKHGAFFSVNLVARKPGKTTVANNPYVKKFFAKTQWNPEHVAIFAGELNYPRYKFWDKLMIRLIMALTKGPTAPDTVKEYTDWREVEAFTLKIAHRNV